MSSVSCRHCRSLVPLGERICATCGAPVEAAQLAALAAQRRARWRLVGLALVAVVAASAVVTWRVLRIPPLRSVTASHDPYVADVSLTVASDERDVGSDGAAVRRLGVLVENRGDSSIECIRIALQVLDAAGEEVTNDRRELRCARTGDPLWPGERATTGLAVPELQTGERLALVVEDLNLGPPGSAAPPLRPLTVSVSPNISITDVSPFLVHQLRTEHLISGATYGEQVVVFTVTALPPLEVTDLAYELRVLGPGGEVLGTNYASVASLARADGWRLPPLLPGRPIAVSVATSFGSPTPNAHWELVVARFATRSPRSPAAAL